MHDASRQFVARFDSRALPEAPEVWRTLVRPYVDVRIEASPHGFMGEMNGTHLGDCLISRSACFATMDHRRNAMDIRRSHVDHLLIQLFTSGDVQGEYGKRAVNAAAGAISVLDLGQTVNSRTTSFSTITLTVPRDRLPTSLRDQKLHGAVLAAELDNRHADAGSANAAGERRGAHVRYRPEQRIGPVIERAVHRWKR